MRTSILGGLMLTVTLLLSSTAGGQQSLTISDGSILGVGSDTLNITMDSTAATEGFVVAIGIDSSLLTVSDLSTAGATDSTGAELAVPEIFADGATLGVVLDAQSPFDGQTIPAGSGTLIASMTVSAATVVSSDTDTSVSFTDGTLNSPALENILVQGGLSIGAGQGLGLNDGTVSLLEPPPATMYTLDASAPADGN